MKHAGEDAFSYLQNVLFETAADPAPARNTK
jgi:hypothetical protein